MKTGKAYTYGLGKNGELGNNSRAVREIVPFCVPKIKGCVACSAGCSFSLILNGNGEVFTCGKSKHGRNGLIDTRVFTIIPSLPKVKQVSAGYWHSLMLDENFQIWSTGYNAHGQLGLGHTNSQASFSPTGIQAQSIKAGGHTSLAISPSRTLLSCGQVSGHLIKPSEFRALPSLTDVSHIDAGQVHCACISNLRLYTWGNNTWGQLGHSGKRTSEVPLIVPALSSIDVIKASCSKGEKNASTGCIDRDGRVFMWGSGYKGKLGLDRSWTHEDPADRDSPEEIEGFRAEDLELGGIHSSALSNGRLFTWGCGSDGRIGHPEVEGHRYLYKEPLPRPIDDIPPVSSISSSYYHNIFIG